MNARKCDRCGKYYDHYKGSLTFQKNGEANGLSLCDEDFSGTVNRRKYYDLCQACMKELMDFIRNPKSN